jgi:hypothetical protein
MPLGLPHTLSRAPLPPARSVRVARSRARSLATTGFRRPSDYLSSFTLYPLHSVTGIRGYFGKCGSVADRRHKTNVEPRAEVTCSA